MKVEAENQQPATLSIMNFLGFIQVAARRKLITDAQLKDIEAICRGAHLSLGELELKNEAPLFLRERSVDEYGPGYENPEISFDRLQEQLSMEIRVVEETLGISWSILDHPEGKKQSKLTIQGSVWSNVVSRDSEETDWWVDVIVDVPVDYPDHRPNIRFGDSSGLKVGDLYILRNHLLLCVTSNLAIDKGKTSILLTLSEETLLFVDDVAERFIIDSNRDFASVPDFDTVDFMGVTSPLRQFAIEPMDVKQSKNSANFQIDKIMSEASHFLDDIKANVDYDIVEMLDFQSLRQFSDKLISTQSIRQEKFCRPILAFHIAEHLYGDNPFYDDHNDEDDDDDAVNTGWAMVRREGSKRGKRGSL
eukprot:TRINITY_DN113_c1_g1_i1.p1 TRINITY_DN113_c1_g1~~TRINITY_DN113_c1_g1_i1.p1  ORF type:complete len:363 (+),score=91.90 TRINITY_DN113_c1_g1_i1:585-1673(+)